MKIFINYRKRDARGHALALYNRLAPEFGPDDVFFDDVTLQPGTKWLAALRSYSGTTGVFLALIGPDWSRLIRERADSSVEDQVRSEIETVLRRGSGVVLIPLLVGDAAMPGEQEVPPSIRSLLLREKFELHPSNWEADVGRLVTLLRRIESDDSHPTPAVESSLPPQPHRPTTPSPQSDASPANGHYDEVVRLLDEGAVIPCLGPGANSCDRDERWHDVDSGFLPDADELAEYLAHRLGLPYNGADLAEISQYVAVERGSGDLYKLLRRTLTQRCPSTAVHHFVAQLPATLDRLGRPQRYQLILTTNYDDALERAFDEAEEPYDLATYLASGNARGKFLHAPFEGEAEVIEIPNEYRAFPISPWGDLERTVIVKIHGGVDAVQGSYTRQENYVITEDDYIGYLSHAGIGSVVPAQILAKLRESHFLFLGYTMREWSLRVFLQRIFGERLPNNSWAIQRSRDRLDSRFWRRIGVDLVTVPLPLYVSDLSTQLQTLASSPG